jgi:hypothetical protein
MSSQKCSDPLRLIPGIAYLRVMGEDIKYGKLSIPKVGDDEPVFILRAQDKLAESAIAMYQAPASSHGTSVAKDVNKEVESFRNWKGAKKLPD